MTTQGQRLAYLDFLRGVAVLGLVLMNITFMGMFEIGYVDFAPQFTSDKVIGAVESLFFDGRFRSLFCLLFAIGLYLQSQSYLNKKLDVKSVLSSRMTWLLCFGFIHCVFIWPGDILILYSLSGFYLLNKLQWDADKLIKRGAVFFAIGVVILAIEVAATAYFDEGMTRSSADFEQSFNNLKGPYWQYMVFNAFVALIYIVTFPLLSLFYICGVMMLGLGLFKSGKLKTGFSNKEVVSLLLVTLIFSVADIMSSQMWPSIGNYGAGVFGYVSGLAMALLIWHFVLVWDVANKTNVFVEAVKRAGSMAFTLYIMQSILLVGLFRFAYPQWNLYFNKANYLTVCAIAIVAQLIIAYAYKSTGKQGPLEYLWRQLVLAKIRDLQQRHKRPELDMDDADNHIRHLRSHKELSQINEASDK